jgi:hypothetical protein
VSGISQRERGGFSFVLEKYVRKNARLHILVVGKILYFN